MSDIKEKFKDAEVASTIIVDNLDTAVEALEYAAAYNALGVLYDPSRTISRLTRAKVAIDDAINAYRNTHWPTDSDYQLLDEIEAEEQRQRNSEWEANP